MAWPSRINRQRRVGRDLDVGTVVVAIVSVAIETVLPHPLDDLKALPVVCSSARYWPLYHTGSRRAKVKTKLDV